MHYMLNIIQFLRNHMFQMNFELDYNEKAEYVEEEKMDNENDNMYLLKMKKYRQWKWKNIDN